jgi:hypothetical protein
MVDRENLLEPRFCPQKAHESIFINIGRDYGILLTCAQRWIYYIHSVLFALNGLGWVMKDQGGWNRQDLLLQDYVAHYCGRDAQSGLFVLAPWSYTCYSMEAGPGSIEPGSMCPEDLWKYYEYYTENAYSPVLPDQNPIESIPQEPA